MPSSRDCAPVLVQPARVVLQLAAVVRQHRHHELDLRALLEGVERIGELLRLLRRDQPDRIEEVLRRRRRQVRIGTLGRRRRRRQGQQRQQTQRQDESALH